MLGETASASSTSIPGVPRCDIDADAVRAARSDLCQLADRVLEPAPTQTRITATDPDHVALVVEVQQGFDDAESRGPRNNPECEDATHAFDSGGLSADELARATAANLHGEFATVVATADLMRARPPSAMRTAPVAGTVSSSRRQLPLRAPNASLS
jgi:hypothetical protein